MFGIKRYLIVTILTLICTIAFVDPSEDSEKDSKLEVTSEKSIDDVAVLNEDEKESIQSENEDDKEESPAEKETVDADIKVELKEEVEEDSKGTEESIKVEFKESVKEELDEKEKETDEQPELSSEGSKESVSEESIETPTSASPLLVKETNNEKEEAPEDTYAVWNNKGKICVLARFNATFTIIYPSKGGEEKAEIHMPGKEGNAKGKCDSTSRSPLLQISWGKNVLTMMFNKSDEENWFVTSVELSYDTSHPLFDRATNAGKKTARSKALSIFEAPVGKSYYCPAQEVVLLYTGNKQVVTARFKDIVLQSYDIKDGKFSPTHRCNKVVLDGLDESPFVQDETVPLAVGCTLALITLCVLIGFSVHRAYNAAKVDYNNME